MEHLSSFKDCCSPMDKGEKWCYDTDQSHNPARGETMPRPRRPFSGQETLTPFTSRYLEDATDQTLGVRRVRRWEAATHFAYPTPNGSQDPLTYLHVLDTLVNIDPSVEIRAPEMVRYLQVTRPQFTWDSVTVGRVVADLCDNFEDVLGAKQGLIERGRDWRGTFYVLHRNPETTAVAWALLDDLYRLSNLEMVERSAGRKTDFMGSPLSECISVRGAFVSPLREDSDDV